MPFNFQTEYLLNAQKKGAQDLHTVIVYHTEREVDDEGDEIGLRRLWVAARGAEGMGVFGAHSAVVRFDEHGTPTSIVRCEQAHPEMEDFTQYAEENELGDIDISTDEHSILLQLWSKIDDELVDYEPEPEDAPDGSLRFKSKIQIPKKQDAVMSEGWDPDDLIEPVTEGWQLFLSFS